MTNLITSAKTSSRLLVELGLVAFVLVLGAAAVAHADTLNRQLEQGMSGPDVSALQTYLAQDSTIYPQGLITGFFGPLTLAAVSNFQARNGIAIVGRVGPITLAAINRLSGIGGSDDANAPVISTVNVGKTASSATVTWTTDEETMGALYYSVFPITITENHGNGPDTVSVAGNEVISANYGLRTSHIVNVQYLQANTRYYYVIRATDQAGNVSVTWPVTFQTKN